jgi:hypothetical protein
MWYSGYDNRGEAARGSGVVSALGEATAHSQELRAPRHAQLFERNKRIRLAADVGSSGAGELALQRCVEKLWITAACA